MCLKKEELSRLNGETVQISGAQDHGETRRDFVSGLDIVSALDSQLFQLGVQRRSLQPKAFGSTVGTADHSLALAEDPKNVFAFRRLQVRIRRFGGLLGSFEFGEGCSQD